MTEGWSDSAIVPIKNPTNSGETPSQVQGVHGSGPGVVLFRPAGLSKYPVGLDRPCRQGHGISTCPWVYGEENVFAAGQKHQRGSPACHGSPQSQDKSQSQDQSHLLH